MPINTKCICVGPNGICIKEAIKKIADIAEIKAIFLFFIPFKEKASNPKLRIDVATITSLDNIPSEICIF